MLRKFSAFLTALPLSSSKHGAPEEAATETSALEADLRKPRSPFPLVRALPSSLEGAAETALPLGEAEPEVRISEAEACRPCSPGREPI